MAQMVRLVDDVDKVSDADRTISFAFAGKEYDIDLCERNAEQITEEMAFWITHARKRGTVPKMLSARQAAEAHAHVDDDTSTDDEWWRTPDDASPAEQKRYHEMRQEIREWGIGHGYPSLGERGKLPRALYAKWRKAHQSNYRHREPEPEDADAEASESDTDPGQAELDMAPRFSDHKPRKAPAKKPASRTRTSAPVRVAS
jgi:hypothetical protein